MPVTTLLEALGERLLRQALLVVLVLGVLRVLRVRLVLLVLRRWLLILRRMLLLELLVRIPIGRWPSLRIAVRMLVLVSLGLIRGLLVRSRLVNIGERVGGVRAGYALVTAGSLGRGAAEPRRARPIRTLKGASEKLIKRS